jgi:two-component system response regulator NreC
MPRTNGLDAARDIRIQAPASKVLVLSAYKDEDTIQKVIDAGVSGYMTKHSAAEELLTAIREVGRGNSYYSPAIAQQMKPRRPKLNHNGYHSSPQSAHLTPRELEVLGLIARGQPNKEIAFTLGVSIKTIEKHRQAAMDKLGIHDVAGLTRYAMAKGLVAPIKKLPR